jgi:hypothetical protein
MSTPSRQMLMDLTCSSIEVLYGWIWIQKNKNNTQLAEHSKPPKKKWRGETKKINSFIYLYESNPSASALIDFLRFLMMMMMMVPPKSQRNLRSQRLPFGVYCIDRWFF